MDAHKIVSREDWTVARKALLLKEKEYTHMRDRLSAERRDLPWVKVEKTYTFETPAGRKTLADLFDGRSQLIVYHFMFAPGWAEGCPGCSLLSDHLDGPNMHLPHHDVAMVAVSRAPLSQIEPFKKRMGWRFNWVSSLGSDFNTDYQVSFTADEVAKGPTYYNYELREDASEGEAPGVSVFYKDEKGQIFHTYSSYGRGPEDMIGALMYLDLTPKGRNETSPMNWVRHHDKYEEVAAGACHAAEKSA